MHPMVSNSQSAFTVIMPSSFSHVIKYLKHDCNKDKHFGIGILALDLDFGLKNANLMI